MKLLKLREKLSHIGLLLLKHGDGFKVTNAGVATITAVDLDFADLTEVEQWIRRQRHANRLTEADDAQWDAEWTAFVAAWRDVMCPDCGQTHPQKVWQDNGEVCPSCGEGQTI